MLKAEVQKSWHDGIVEMFDLDLTPITGDVNDKFYFTNQVRPDGTKVVWKGNTYEPLPLLSSGYEKATTGQIAQPTLTVANVMGTFTQAIDGLDDMVGAKVTRRRTLGKYLDGEPGADSTQEFPIDIFYIERKASENALSITWQLASILDLEGLMLPRRVITQNYCQWKYRSSECGYTGPPVFKIDDFLISANGQSAAAAEVINNYALVQSRQVELQVAINAKNAAAANKEASCSSIVLLETQFNNTFTPGPDYYVRVFKSGTYYYGGTASSVAVWNSSQVVLGTTYRQGSNQGGGFYAIERWGTDPGACGAATTALINAENAVNAAINNLNNARTALNNSVAALPPDDPLWQQDLCGKRVSSCRLRFPNTPLGNQPLPFGGFPGAIATRQ